MLTPEQEDAIEGWCEKYKSHLCIEQIAEGISVSIENARKLCDDGLLLFEASHFARAMSLFIAAMEEVGKVSVLCSMARIPKNNQALWAECWRDFRSHENKATRAFIHTYPEEASQYPDLIMAAAFQQYRLSPLGERLRQAGLYADFHAREKRWSSPNEVTQCDAELWLNRLQPALARVQQMAELGLLSARALELQREVYGPINVDRPRRKEMSPDQFDKIKQRALNAHRQYFRRLVEAGVLTQDADLQVMSVPLRQFIREA